MMKNAQTQQQTHTKPLIKMRTLLNCHGDIDSTWPASNSSTSLLSHSRQMHQKRNSKRLEIVFFLGVLAKCSNNAISELEKTVA
eukprot:812890-Amphidinium_carterae.1